MRTRVGYAGGRHKDPTYHDLGDHTEAFALDFDPRVISYDELLATFWSAHRPDRESYSTQYMAAAFPNAAQLDRAMATRDQLRAKTPVIANARFYLAEDYHQKYYLRHDRVLMRELEGYTPAQLVDSTLAARLNGLVAGHACNIDELGLSPAAREHLRARTGRRMQCG